jgi:hypothetical protein
MDEQVKSMGGKSKLYEEQRLKVGFQARKYLVPVIIALIINRDFFKFKKMSKSTNKYK